jgi:hypothetical protein
MPIVGSIASGSISSFGRSIVDYGGSAYFVGGNQYLQVNSTSSNYEYGTGPWTVEMWYYPIVSLSGTRLLWSQQFTGRRFWIYSSNGQLVWHVNSNPSIVTSLSLTLNAWNHIAFVRNTATSTATFYLNGVACGSTASTASYTTNQYGPIIGQLYGQVGSYGALGLITNLRVAKSAIYTSNFTPSLVPFTKTSQGATNVQLLLNQKSAANLLTDSSANNVTILNSSPATTWAPEDPYSVPYVTPPVVVIVTATVTPSTLTPNEGDTITYTVAGTNTTNGTYYYTIEPSIGSEASLTTADFSSASLSGSFTITGNAGSFTTTLTRDLLTESTEAFSVFVRTTSITGTIIGISDEITISDTSITPSFTSTPTSINEGSAGSFTVANVGPDGTYYWTILNGTTANADFDATSGSFTVSGHTGSLDNGTGTFSVTPSSDRATEGAQTFQVEVRSGSIAGPVLITSSSVTVNDISLTPSITLNGSYNEGNADSPTVSNLGPAGTYYWTIDHITTTNADFLGSTSGSFTTLTANASSQYFTFQLNPDITTEGNETFTISIRTGSTSGPAIVTSSVITAIDYSKTETATLTPSPNPVAEGGTVTISVTSSGPPAGSTLTWRVVNGTTTNADFVATTGTYGTGFGTGSFTVSIATLGGAEAAETFQVELLGTQSQRIGITAAITISANAT